MKRALWSQSFGFRCHPCILLLTGAYTNSASWPAAFPHRLVDRGFRVLAVDHRDFGKNRWCNDESYTLDDMADDVLFTMTVERIRAAHVVGVSMGGAVALRMLLKNPCRFKSASLFASTPGRCFMDDTLPSPTQRVQEAMRRELALIEEGSVERALELREQTFGAPSDDAERRAVRRRGFNAATKQGEACLRSPGVTHRLAEIRTPTLVVHGEDDELYPTPHAWRLHHGLADSKMLLIPRLNHRFPAEQSRALADAVADHALTRTIDWKHPTID